MTVTTTAHINSRGQARDMLDFYGKAFHGEVTVATYTDIHAAEDPSHADQVAWGQVTAPNGFRVMAYDVQPSKTFDAGENAFYIALRGDDAGEIQQMWDGLADGATVLTPLGPAPFAPLYGMLTDRYGVTWIVDVTPSPN
ncbi:VOC family protein [Actinoplanes sp. LDG1-06]|uniref:VOC family protein n=1 Tax=Paractinoplanes ovalisporus TaxID=2810368 RepID=A0ABS2A3Z8_9ACTN|nr:VOC family protein [Actinoplanes ovalisporus]MBM2614537.1 VOC family protein [Actinoplanes ovalisporus]